MGKIIKKKMNKKLKINDINKSSNQDLGHTIKGIKANERKYTIILVCVFMIIFAVIGYFNFRVDNSLLINTDQSFYRNVLSASSMSVTLNNTYIKSDDIGKKDSPYVVNVNNNTCNDINYRVELIRTDKVNGLCKCGNKLLDIKNIKYSIDGGDVSLLNKNSNGDTVVVTGTLKSGKSKSYDVRLWVSDEVSKLEDYHFHGYFKVVKIEDFD